MEHETGEKSDKKKAELERMGKTSKTEGLNVCWKEGESEKKNRRVALF
jgi:hypothetical protein